MNIFFAVVFVAVSTICILRSVGFKGVGVAVCICALCMLSFTIERICEIKNELAPLLEGGILDGCMRSLFKILGITYLVGYCEDMCNDMGESGLGKAVEVWGRVEILAALTPLFVSAITLGGELL